MKLGAAPSGGQASGFSPRDRRMSAGRGLLLVAMIVLTASLSGIFTRGFGFLPAFWPANAVLMGMFLRYPRLATPAGWLAAFLGYVAADLLTGGHLDVALWLTAANLANVATCCFLFRRLPEEDRLLRRPPSVLYLFGIASLGALAAAIVAASISPVFYGEGLFAGMAFWFTAELVNTVVVLPVILTMPEPSGFRLRLRRSQDWRAGFLKVVPLLALGLSVAAELLIGGPGAIAFPVPALLWCALTYGLFTTVVLTLLVNSWKIVAVSGYAQGFPGLVDFMDATMSFRLGITLLALGPLTVATINSARNELLRRLDHTASHDSLTDTLTRSAFMGRGRALLEPRTPPLEPGVAVLMLDIDHFKQVNDRHGHATGDKVLAVFAAAVKKALRSQDLFGRLGGEEFAVILPRTGRIEAVRVAERIRRAVESLVIVPEGGARLGITVSIGVAVRTPTALASLDHFLSMADKALYRAKAAGRNRVESAA